MLTLSPNYHCYFLNYAQSKSACVRIKTLTAVGLITAVPTVGNTVAPGVLLQDAGAAAALVSDCRAGRFYRGGKKKKQAYSITVEGSKGIHLSIHPSIKSEGDG